MRALFTSSRLVLWAMVLALCIGGLAGWQLLQARQAEWRKAEVTGGNLLFAVNFVLERTLSRADRGIRHAVSLLNESGSIILHGVSQHADIFHAQEDDALGSLLILDEHGRIIDAAQPGFPESRDLSDADYFQVHKNRADVGLYVSLPFVSRHDGRASFALSRRWVRPDGSFGGVVSQTIKLDVLQNLFSAIDLGPGSSMNLFLDDGHLLMRVPFVPEMLGASLAGTPNVDLFIREGSGIHVGVAAIDNIRRLYVFQRVDGYPIIVNTAQSAHAALAGWRQNAMWLGGFTLLLMLACVGLAVFAQRELNAHRRAVRDLRRADRNLRTVIDNAPALVAYWDRNLYNRFANEVHERWLGQRGASLQGRHLSTLMGRRALQRIMPRIEAVLAGQTQVFEMWILNRDGERRYATCSLVPDQDGAGTVDGFFAMLYDITQRKHAEASLLAQKERFRVTLESIRDAVLTTDPSGRLSYLNPAACALTGWSYDEALGRPIGDVVVLSAAPGTQILAPQSLVMKAMAEGMVKRVRQGSVLHGLNGQHVDIEASVARITNEGGEVVGSVMVLHDVTLASTRAEKMAQLALHDSLTGLANRRFLRQLAEQALADAQRNQTMVALLYLDLDGFKAVNDTLGHAAGDALLIDVSNCWRGELRGGDIFARVGGDEFVIFMRHLKSRDDAVSLARRILGACHGVGAASLCSHQVTTSIGISIWPEHGADFDTLMARADQAMYRAKLSGNNQYHLPGD